MTRFELPGNAPFDVSDRHAPSVVLAELIARVWGDLTGGTSEHLRVRFSANLDVVDDAGVGVPVSAAAALLGLSQQTVRAWVDRGVLTSIDGVRPVQVSVRSLGEVLSQVRRLRAAGTNDRELANVLHQAESLDVQRRLRNAGPLRLRSVSLDELESIH